MADVLWKSYQKEHGLAGAQPAWVGGEEKSVDY